jgi:hypothetical protein
MQTNPLFGVFSMPVARLGLLPAVILGAALAFAGWSVGQGVERFRMADRTVTVKGLAEMDVKSDFAIWTLAFRRGGNAFDEVQRQLSADREQVVAFLAAQGFSADEIEARPLQVQDLLAREWGNSNVALRFTGQGQVAKAANASDPLIQAGVQLDNQDGYAGPRYQLRGFNDVKPQLLEEATRNAREQAAKFAADAGATLGGLKNANQGVISVNSDDGGDMDSSRTIGKRLRVVSTFQFGLE